MPAVPTFHDMLKTARHNAGLSTIEMANACGISDNMLRRYEVGIAFPPEHIFLRMHQILNNEPLCKAWAWYNVNRGQSARMAEEILPSSAATNNPFDKTGNIKFMTDLLACRGDHIIRELERITSLLSGLNDIGISKAADVIAMMQQMPTYCKHPPKRRRQYAG